jgi:hypothetical protein
MKRYFVNAVSEDGSYAYEDVQEHPDGDWADWHDVKQLIDKIKTVVKISENFLTDDHDDPMCLIYNELYEVVKDERH